MSCIFWVTLYLSRSGIPGGQERVKAAALGPRGRAHSQEWAASMSALGWLLGTELSGYTYWRSVLHAWGLIPAVMVSPGGLC